MARLTELEAEGAEFLVLGNLLIKRIVAHKTYTNMLGYDLVAVAPDNHRSARVQVKSRWHTKVDGFPIKRFDCDFVVYVALNRGQGIKDATGRKEPEVYVFPVAVVAAVHRDGPFPKVYFKDIPDLASYRDRWDLVREFLEV